MQITGCIFGGLMEKGSDVSRDYFKGVARRRENKRRDRGDGEDQAPAVFGDL